MNEDSNGRRRRRLRRVKNKMEQWMMMALRGLHESRPSNNRNQLSTSNFGSCNLYANFIKENADVLGVKISASAGIRRQPFSSPRK